MSSNDLHKTVMGFRDPIYKNCIHANNLEIFIIFRRQKQLHTLYSGKQSLYFYIASRALNLGLHTWF